jgi:hypothetical protein
MADTNLRRRMAAIARAPGDPEVNLHTAPDDDLTREELIRIRHELEEKLANVEKDNDEETLAQWTMGAVNCYKENALELLDTAQERFLQLSGGPQIPPERQQAVTSMINTVMRASAASPDGRIPIVSHDGLVGSMDPQDMAATLVAGAEVRGLSDRDRIRNAFLKLLAKAFFGTGAVGVGSLAFGIRRLSEFITNLSNTIVAPLPEAQRDNGKLVLSTGMYVLVYYYLLPILASKAFSAAANCAVGVCAKMSAAAGGMCSIQGGKKKSRRHRSYKKRRSRKAHKSRKGRKSPKRKVKRGKTHKRKARKGRKSHKRKH